MAHFFKKKQVNEGEMLSSWQSGHSVLIPTVCSLIYLFIKCIISLKNVNLSYSKANKNEKEWQWKKLQLILLPSFSALTYNFGEQRKNPDKVRQKYLDQFFGPTAIAGHALRAFRNPFFAFTFRFWYDLVFHTKNMTESLSKTHIVTIRDTILSEPWLHAKIFRDTCSFYFTSIGWAIYYIWCDSSQSLGCAFKQWQKIDKFELLIEANGHSSVDHAKLWSVDPSQS